LKNPSLIASLHLRGLNQERLAALIGSSRSHVCQVLLKKPGRGGKTRKKLAAHLNSYELTLLGWDEKGRPFHVESSKCSKIATPVLDSFRQP